MTDLRERYDLLHQWRKRKAQARGVESDVIVSRDALRELARAAPRTGKNSRSTIARRGWEDATAR